MTNTWDAAIFGALWLVACVAAFLSVGWSLLPAVVGTVRHLGPPVALAHLAVIGVGLLGLDGDEATVGGAGVLSRLVSDPERIAEDNALDMTLYDHACRIYEERHR